MFVNNLMLAKEDIISVAPEDSIEKALEGIKKNDFLSIPVVKNGIFYGAASKEDILSFYYENTIDQHCVVDLSQYKIKEIMRKDLPTVLLKDYIEDAAYLLEVNKATFVAVLDDEGSFMGIITHKAILKEFTELFGLNKGKRLSVIAYDIPGQISKLTKIITENKGDIISCVVEDPKSKFEVKEIIMRIKTDNFEHILHRVESAGFKVE